MVQILLGIAGFMTITSVLMTPKAPWGWAAFPLRMRIGVVLTFAAGILCVAAAFDRWTRLRLLPGAAGVWLLYDAGCLVRTGEQIRWPERLRAIRNLRPVKLIEETTPAFIGAPGYSVVAPTPEVIRAALGEAGVARPKIEELRPGLFVGGDEEFMAWFRHYDRSTRTFTWRGGGFRASGRILWETVVPRRLRALIEFLAGLCLLLALFPSPVQTEATTVRNRGINGFGTALFALGLLVLLIQLWTRRFRAFVGYSLVYGALFLFARLVGWRPPGL
jgi:hypothetical protein